MPPRATMTGLRSIAIAASALALSACVSVRLEGADGDVRIERHLGVLYIALANPRQALVGTVAGVGVVGAPMAWSVGYTRQRWALLGTECRAVVWLPPGEVSAATRAELAAAATCLVDEGGDPATTAAATEEAP